ncbi:MAG TPA: histidine--tRNA ligase [Actinomycetota bacterium]|jgi:histidyl-tRNA synthetase|nr:histidine--tRNA ligase [Actinomycetota bacterium]
MSQDRVSFRAPKGTRDVVPPESWRLQALYDLARSIFAGSGYAPVETPAFEHTEVFARGVGETSEVVTKQMYTFPDKAGRSLTLRPESTAPVVRAVLEHGLHRGALPVKLYYAGPQFRQERPQKGRYRQFLQVGIEAIGSARPTVDAEVVEIGHRFLRAAGVEPRLKLNSIGHPADECRLGYGRALVEYLRAHEADLAEEDRGRIDTNPLRTFDSKEPETRKVMEGAPVITEHLCPECKAHFDAVQDLLSRVGVPFTIDPRIVRGLDYYTRTAFEFVAGGLGSQDAVGGGGRYDGLARSLGGDDVPGIGFALGVDRILLAQSDDGGAPRPVEVYVVAVGDEAASPAFELVTRLRSAGIGADLDHLGRGMKGQMKDADRSGAHFAAILGSDEIAAGEVTLKDLEAGAQERVPIAEIERRVRP